MTALAILVLGEGGMATARSIQSYYPQSKIYGWAKRTTTADIAYTEFAQTCRNLYQQQLPIVGICSAGILIRSLAPLLGDKTKDPPVLAVSEDGSAVVPLLGGLGGANELAQTIALIFATKPAITSSGTNRFNLTLLSPPPGYKLLNSIDQAKSFLADLLAGASVKIIGDAPWLTNSNLPISPTADHTIEITRADSIPNLSSTHLGYQYCPQGKLAVVGIGAGKITGMTHQVRQILADATDIVGYHSYLKLIEPLVRNKTIHSSDNQQELDRAQLALDLAHQGRSVVVVSGGDCGIFGMATALLEVIDRVGAGVEVTICPGVSAFQTLAAKVGAPMGHDFCVISLSDRLKPWSIIEQRLRAAAGADFVIALYNPASLTRREQIATAQQILLAYRSPHTPVIVGKNLDRPEEAITITTLAELEPTQINMQTIVIVGSSQTKVIQAQSRPWVYTPRYYQA